MCNQFTALISAAAVSVYVHVTLGFHCRPAEKHSENTTTIPTALLRSTRREEAPHTNSYRGGTTISSARLPPCQSQSPNSSFPEVPPPREPYEQSQPAAPSPPLYRACLRTRTTGTPSPNPTSSVRRRILRAVSCKLAMAKSPADR